MNVMPVGVSGKSTLVKQLKHFSSSHHRPKVNHQDLDQNPLMMANGLQMAKKSPCLYLFHMRQLGNLMKLQLDLTVEVLEEIAYHNQQEVQGRSKKVEGAIFLG